MILAFCVAFDLRLAGFLSSVIFFSLFDHYSIIIRSLFDDYVTIIWAVALSGAGIDRRSIGRLAIIYCPFVVLKIVVILIPTCNINPNMAIFHCPFVVLKIVMILIPTCNINPNMAIIHCSFVVLIVYLLCVKGGRTHSPFTVWLVFDHYFHFGPLFSPLIGAFDRSFPVDGRRRCPAKEPARPDPTGCRWPTGQMTGQTARLGPQPGRVFGPSWPVSIIFDQFSRFFQLPVFKFDQFWRVFDQFLLVLNSFWPVFWGTRWFDTGAYQLVKIDE